MMTAECEPRRSYDSRKARLVALFIILFSAAHLISGLYVVMRSPAHFGGFTSWAEWAFASTPIVLVIGIMPLYFALKIWRRPTLENLRRAPFIAVLLCYMTVVGVGVILGGLFEIFGVSLAYTEMLDSSLPLAILLSLGIYFPVKKAMASWFRMPELAQPRFQIKTRRSLWRVYCFFLWVTVQTLGDDLVEHFYSARAHEGDLFVLVIQMIVFVVAVYVAIYVYKKGLRPLGLRPV